MKIGYARVSTQDQELGLQLDALEQAGCEKIYQEKCASFHSVNDQIDTTSAHGKFTFHIFAWLAEFERDII